MGFNADQVGERGQGRLLMGVAVVPDHPAAGDHHVLERWGVARKDQRVGDRAVLPPGQRRAVQVGDHDVGGTAGFQPGGRQAQRLGAAACRRRPQPVAAVLGRQHRAAAGSEPLLILQPAQLLDRADRDVAVRAQAEAAAGVQEGGGGKQAVAQVGLGGRAQADHGT